MNIENVQDQLKLKYYSILTFIALSFYKLKFKSVLMLV